MVSGNKYYLFWIIYICLFVCIVLIGRVSFFVIGWGFVMVLILWVFFFLFWGFLVFFVWRGGRIGSVVFIMWWFCMRNVFLVVMWFIRGWWWVVILILIIGGIFCRVWFVWVVWVLMIGVDLMIMWGWVFVMIFVVWGGVGCLIMRVVILISLFIWWWWWFFIFVFIVRDVFWGGVFVIDV